MTSKGDDIRGGSPGFSSADEVSEAGAQASAPVEPSQKDRAGSGKKRGRRDTQDSLAAARAEARDWKERAARAQAEFENTRKRLIAQQEEATARATDRVIEGLLPVVDDLDLAIAHGQESGSELCSGLVAIREKILAAFAGEGVEVIDPQVGEPFDHGTQSAMQMIDSPDLPDQSVAQVFQKGYLRGARVIRPALVIVAKS